MIEPYKGIKTNDNSLIPLLECVLEANSNVLECTLMNKVTINGDLGIVKGYIYPKGDVSRMIYPDMGQNSNLDKFVNINDIPHIYATESEKSNMIIKIKNMVFHQVYITRFKSTDIFSFIAKITISDIEKLKNIIKEELENGSKNLRITER